jgi:hypothetical protein
MWTQTVSAVSRESRVAPSITAFPAVFGAADSACPRFQPANAARADSPEAVTLSNIRVE